MRRVLSCLALMAVVGCGGEPRPNEELGEDASEIINGGVNTTHDAVVACFGDMQLCSGTVVHHDGFNAFVLSAAHCMYRPNTNTLQPLNQCASADDFNATADWAALVSDYEIHPSYDSDQNVYDFVMLRLPNVTSTSVIPAMQPAEDVLSVGSDVLNVGFGTTVPGGGGNNSQRRSTTNTLSELYQLQIVWDDQPTSGPCSGDSGGPSISSISGAERVAGVISFGDQNCQQLGVSGRVSAVYPWIASFTGQNPTTTSATTTTGAGGATTTSTGAGGAGAGGASASSSTGSSTGWFAGDTEKNDNDAILVSSCNTGHSRDDGAAWWLALLGLTALSRRRL